MIWSEVQMIRQDHRVGKRDRYGCDYPRLIFWIDGRMISVARPLDFLDWEFDGFVERINA